MINNIGGYRPSSAPRGASMIRADNRFGEVLAAKANRTDTFSRSSAPASAVSAEQLSSVNETQRKLDKIDQDIKNTDYSGMTKSEIYADIEGRYKEAFDDFYAANWVTVCKDHEMIQDKFREHREEYVGKMSGEELKEARGYAGMTDEEMEAAIKEKYIGKTGLIDQLNLFGELFATGILSRKYGDDEAFYLNISLRHSVERRGDSNVSKDEWLASLEERGADSAFDLLVNNKYYSPAERAWFRSVINDILFGII